MKALDAFEAFAHARGCVCRAQEPMAQHTSYAIGGPAELFVEVADEAVLPSLLREARRLELPVLPVGNGTNLLVSDFGIEGVVLHLTGLNHIQLEGASRIVCGAGVRLAKLCAFAQEHSLSGLECAWGIPGSAGGAAYINAGAYGFEIKDVLLSCKHVAADGTEGEWEAEALGLGYRTSAYVDTGAVITSLRLQLSPGNAQTIRAMMDDLMQRRKAKQPLEYPSCGSVFKRPPGQYAGTLIEQCGLKGLRVGGAAVSEKHANFIINVDHATCSDVKRLMEKIRRTVFMQTSIELEPEVRFVGRA